MSTIKNNYEETASELKAFLETLRTTTFSGYDTTLGSNSIRVTAFKAEFEIIAEFSLPGTRITQAEEGVFQKMGLLLEVRSQSWSERDLGNAGLIEILLMRVLTAAQEVKKVFGSRDVYFLIGTKKEQQEVNRFAIEYELQKLVKKHTKGLRVGQKADVASILLERAVKKLLVEGDYEVGTGSHSELKHYFVRVDPEKHLHIARVS
jgi:hypothetical protein